MDSLVQPHGGMTTFLAAVGLPLRLRLCPGGPAAVHLVG